MQIGFRIQGHTGNRPDGIQESRFLSQNVLLRNVSCQNVQGNVTGADIHHQHLSFFYTDRASHRTSKIREVGAVQRDFIDPKFRFFQQI